jgi:chitooligosaccharide deacetylase
MLVKCHRQASALGNRVYLTFDDGPVPESTDEVLAVLAHHRVTATFFVVAETAARHPELMHRVIAGGHSVGNHSLNHSFRPFFAGRGTMRDWIRTAETTLAKVTGLPSIGWRSPAGIQTPPLHAVLKELSIPLIHWNTRFYDAVKPWTWEKAEKSLATIRPGAIVLLHDKQKKEHRDVFLSTLDRYIGSLKERGLVPVRIERSDLLP